jgi:hypothetical protein
MTTPEYRFLSSSNVDRLAALVLELAAQLHEERHQRIALEQALQQAGLLNPAALAAAGVHAHTVERAQAGLDRSMKTLLEIMTDPDSAQAPLDRNGSSATLKNA